MTTVSAAAVRLSMLLVAFVVVVYDRFRTRSLAFDFDLAGLGINEADVIDELERRDYVA